MWSFILSKDHYLFIQYSYSISNPSGAPFQAILVVPVRVVLYSTVLGGTRRDGIRGIEW